MYDLFGQSGRFDYFNHKRVEIAGETKEEESTEEQEQEGSIPFFLNEGSQEEKGEKEENEMNKGEKRMRQEGELHSLLIVGSGRDRQENNREINK